MPTRLAAALAERVGAPAAVVTLVGATELVHYGYMYGNSSSHIEGPNGPRGGRRTLCGRPYRNYWWSYDLEFPIHRPYYDQRDATRWRNTCADCKAALGGNFDA